MTEVTINKQATMKAEGIHTTKGCKQVVCITDRRTFTSVLDAAKAYNAAPGDISRCCNGKSRGRHMVKGKKFCFLKDINMHLDEIFTEDRVLTEKAAAYDVILAEERAAKEAEEKRKAELAKAEATYAKIDEEYNKLAARLVEMQNKRTSAHDALVILREQNEAYAL